MPKREPLELEGVLGRALSALASIGVSSALIGGIAVNDLRDARWLLGSAGESLDLDAVRAHLSPFGPEHLARLEALLRGG